MYHSRSWNWDKSSVHLVLSDVLSISHLSFNFTYCIKAAHLHILKESACALLFNRHNTLTYHFHTALLWSFAETSLPVNINGSKDTSAVQANFLPQQFNTHEGRPQNNICTFFYYCPIILYMPVLAQLCGKWVWFTQPAEQKVRKNNPWFPPNTGISEGIYHGVLWWLININRTEIIDVP